VRDEHGRPVNSKLDAAKLTEIAKVTGGFYQPYGQDAAKIIYEKGILPIEGKDSGTLSSLKPIERYDWPVTAALVLLTLWSLLGEGRRKGSFIGALILAMGFFLNLSSLQASGINDYQQGNYQGALKDFEQRIQSGASSPEVRFDAGAAAYKEGDYKKAAGYFSEAMTSGNSKIRDAATYNLANSLVRTGEAAQEKEGKLSDWKNALQHYESVLKSTPKNTQAKENRDIVRKLIENLKKQDKKKDPKDQKDQDKNKEKDQQKNDSSQGGGDGKKDQKDQHSKPDQQAKDDQKQEGKDKGGDQQKNQDQNKKEDAGNSQGENQKAQEQPSPQQDQKGQPTPTPSPSPDQEKGQERNPQQQNSSGSQPKDQGQQQGGAAPKPTSTPAENMKAPPSAEQGEKPEKSSSATEAAADENKEGKMSANQARALLRSMQDEEQHVLNQQNRAVEQPLHDW
jgi:Ca-activated chloride channel family protein